MPFAVPVVWREPSNHSSDCYFCLTPPVATSMNRKKKQRIDYSNISSAIRPMPHGEDFPVPEPPKEYNLNLEMKEEDTEKTGPHKEEPTDPDFQGPASESPHKLTQNELNDLVRDLELPKVKAELLASRMKQWKYLDEGVKITVSSPKKSGRILYHGGHSSDMQRCGWPVQSIKHEPLLRWMEAIHRFLQSQT